MVTEAQIETRIDEILTKYKTTAILYYPYQSGTLDIYKQRTKTFGTSVSLVGRAIHRPTSEMISIIGDDETYEIAFLFSRLQLVEKFPLAEEGEWMDTSGQMEWRSRRYRIEKVHPTGQVGETFLMTVVLANSIPGQRDS